MKKLGFILVLFLMISVDMFGQNITEVKGVYLTSELKPYSGKYTSQFDNGNIKLEMYLNKGLKEGQVKLYFPSGQLNEIRSYPKTRCMVRGSFITKAV